MPEDVAGRVVLDQAVSFFFVLSGFILTYVHPRLDEGQRAPFLWARMARIWPAHLAAIVVLFVLVGVVRANAVGPVSTSVALANVLLLHAWIPLQTFFFSFNGVSWTISVEVFFYLTFPLLLIDWERTWHLKLLFALGVALVMVALATAWGLPPFEPGSTGITMEAVVYINPLARWFEFVLGMAAAVAWRRLDSTVRVGPLAGTIVELAAMALAGTVIYETLPWTARVPWLGRAGRVWLLHGPISAPSFAALIVVMASERGFVSRLLCRDGPVLLGEISYSIYLLHQIWLRWYAGRASVFAAFPGRAIYGTYWSLVVLSAYLVWRFIERPSRRILVGWWPIPEGRRVAPPLD